MCRFDMIKPLDKHATRLEIAWLWCHIILQDWLQKVITATKATKLHWLEHHKIEDSWKLEVM